MFRHCVAGIDFSAGWDQVHARLRRMAALLGIQELTLVHVDEPQVWGHKDFADAAGSVRLEQAAADLRSSLGLQVHAQLASGLPAKALLDVALRQHADLLAVANRSHARGAELLLGNAALSLAGTSRLPLLIVPFEEGSLAEGTPLLLVSDRSAAAAKARAIFLELLGEREGRVMLVQGSGQQVSLAEAEALEALAASRGKIEVGTVAGDAVSEVCRVARNLEAPLIIVGKRCPEVAGEPLLDSRLEELCRKTPSPLLLIPS